MDRIKGEKGVVLLVVLVLSGVALLIAAGLLYMAMQSTKTSGSSKRYKTALEAGRAGADVVYQLIDSRPTTSAPFTIGLAHFTIVDNNRLFNASTGKLYAVTTTWTSTNNTTINIDPTNNGTYDVYFDMGSNPAYRVYAKITDTVLGNSYAASSGGLGLHKYGVVAGSSSGAISAPSYPYLYSIEILALNAVNPQERAKLSILYQY